VGKSPTSKRSLDPESNGGINQSRDCSPNTRVSPERGAANPPPLLSNHQEITVKKTSKGGGKNKWKGDVHGKKESSGMKRMNK
jgi:hypothetical protein